VLESPLFPVEIELNQTLESRLGEMEKVREGAYAAIREQVASMADEQDKLRSETANLISQYISDEEDIYLAF
jgi:hypothetical protein